MKNIQNILNQIENNPSSSVDMYNSMEADSSISPYEAIRTLEALEKMRLNPKFLNLISKEEKAWKSQGKTVSEEVSP